MKFAYYIAQRYLRSRRHSRFLSRVSVTVVVGIGLGVMVLDLTLAIMNGFHAELRGTFVDNMPMITVVTGEPTGFSDLGAVIDSIGTEPGVIGIAPFIRQEVVISSLPTRRPARHKGAVIWGIEPVLQETVTPLADRLLPRQAMVQLLQVDPTPGSTQSILLGIELALSLVVGLGDTILVTAPSADFELDELKAESREFILAGLLDTGMYEFDSRFAYINMEPARDFFAYGPQGATGIGIKVLDMMTAPDIGDRIEERLGRHHYRAIDWIAMNQNLFRWIQIEKVVMFLLLGLIVLVAAFNIIGILTMMVGERSREIGILLSMGAKRGQIQNIFMIDGLYLGGLGVVIGSLLGFLGTVALEKFGFKLPGDVYFLDHVPVIAQWEDFLAVGGVAIVITLLATFGPSREAAKLKPMQIIRYT